MTQQPAQGPLDEALIALHESYVWRVNAAVSLDQQSPAAVARQFLGANGLL